MVNALELEESTGSRRAWLANVRKPIFTSGATLAAVVAATVARWLIDPALDEFSYPTFFFAASFAAWTGGLRPALLATGLGFIFARNLFTPPRFSLSFTSGAQFLGLTMYLMVTA